jgi:hypothetical protein
MTRQKAVSPVSRQATTAPSAAPLVAKSPRPVVTTDREMEVTYSVAFTSVDSHIESTDGTADAITPTPSGLPPEAS